MAFVRKTPKVGTNSGRRGQSTVAAHVRFDAASMIAMSERLTGQFRPGAGDIQMALSRANERAAISVQNAMVASINRQVRARGRPQRPGQRLVTSIANEKNREVFANTFSVGLTRWLDRSPSALYYRQIDEGMGSFPGNVLFTRNGGTGWSDFGPPYNAPKKGSKADLRMPQFSRKGVFVEEIGPYPAFHYSEAGQEALADFPMKTEYMKELKAAGIPISDIFNK